MNYLFIHQNFPGQFLLLAQSLSAEDGNNVVGLGEAVNIERRGQLSGLTTIGYPTPQGSSSSIHPYLQSTEAGIRRGQTVARSIIRLLQKGFKPDVVCVHPGWGEGLFLRTLFPQTPIMMFCEFFFQAHGGDINFDPEFPSSSDIIFSLPIRNAVQTLSLPYANACVCPTRWQASRYPEFLRKKIHLIHDGINIAYMFPDPTDTVTLTKSGLYGDSSVVVPNQRNQETSMPRAVEDAGETITLTRQHQVITYVARNLEPYRGFHTFIRALPALQQRYPDAHVIIVGGTEVSYSPALPDNQTYKEKYLADFKDALDFSRIHFTGKVPYSVLRSIFRISSAHIYLTYPFVLSWSMMEAMACEALIIGSKTPPVEEVITHGKNGILVDFFSHEQLVHAVGEALENPHAFAAMRQAARTTITEQYSADACLTLQKRFLRNLIEGRYPLE